MPASDFPASRSRLARLVIVIVIVIVRRRLAVQTELRLVLGLIRSNASASSSPLISLTNVAKEFADASSSTWWVMGKASKARIRWSAQPLDPALSGAARVHSLMAVAEDNGRVGAVGDAVARLLRDTEVDTPVRTFGIPQEFLDHAKRAEILTDLGLTPQDLARNITEVLTRISQGEAEQPAAAAALRPASVD